MMPPHLRALTEASGVHDGAWAARYLMHAGEVTQEDADAVVREARQARAARRAAERARKGKGA